MEAFRGFSCGCAGRGGRAGSPLGETVMVIPFSVSLMAELIIIITKAECCAFQRWILAANCVAPFKASRPTQVICAGFNIAHLLYAVPHWNHINTSVRSYFTPAFHRSLITVIICDRPAILYHINT